MYIAVLYLKAANNFLDLFKDTLTHNMFQIFSSYRNHVNKKNIHRGVNQHFITEGFTKYLQSFYKNVM